MSAILKLLAKEKSFDILMEKRRNSLNNDTDDQIQNIDIKQGPQSPDHVYKYHYSDWQQNRRKSIPVAAKPQRTKPISEVTTEQEMAEEEKATEEGCKSSDSPKMVGKFF
uniref:Uncharacterized protein n=1 Tax=Acrobeloides nanus TaxID=290746 RepID=A0A914C8F2_9BILA